MSIDFSEGVDGEREPREGLADQAFALLYAEILSGQLKPGSTVTEADLTGLYGLTKAPVRTAIARLVHEGWLVAQSKRRIVVKPITLRDVREVFDLRKTLEPEAARRAAGRVDEKQLAMLDKEVSAEYDPTDLASETRFFSANARFHVLIAEAAGNSRASRMIEKLHDESQRILRVGMKYANWSKGWQHGHRDLIDALAAGDGERAASVALRQLERSERVVMDAMTDMFDAVALGDLRN